MTKLTSAKNESIKYRVSQLINNAPYGTPALPLLRLEGFAEGKAVQIMHIGPYSEEGPTIKKLHEAIVEQGNRLTGTHHEIYLGDPARSAPDKLKTIIRQPFL